MAKKKIYINPGHCDKDPGAVKYETERTLNVAVSNHMKDYLLENYDCEIRMNPGTMGGLYDICADANIWGASLFVSNHFNAGGGDGYEALVHNEGRVALGQIFEKHVKAIGQNSRGVKLRPNLAVLRLTVMPAVLNEGAFVDNWSDIQDWNDDGELQALGIAYAKAAAEYLGLEEKTVVDDTYGLEHFIKNAVDGDRVRCRVDRFSTLVAYVIGDCGKEAATVSHCSEHSVQKCNCCGLAVCSGDSYQCQLLRWVVVEVGCHYREGVSCRISLYEYSSFGLLRVEAQRVETLLVFVYDHSCTLAQCHRDVVVSVACKALYRNKRGTCSDLSGVAADGGDVNASRAFHYGSSAVLYDSVKSHLSLICTVLP